MKKRVCGRVRKGAEVGKAAQSGGPDRTSQMRRKEDWIEDGASGGGGWRVAMLLLSMPQGLQGSKAGGSVSAAVSGALWVLGGSMEMSSRQWWHPG